MEEQTLLMSSNQNAEYGAINQHLLQVDGAKSTAQVCSGLEKPQNSEKRLAQRRSERRRIILSSIVCVIFMVVELIGGWYSNSLAIFADAFHMLTDLASNLIALAGLWLASRSSSSTFSFGWYRAETLAALFSLFLTWLLTGILVYEAALRLKNPEKVDGRTMFIIGCVGMASNIGMFVILGGHGHSHGGPSHGHSHGSSHSHSAHSHGSSHSHSHSHAHNAPSDDHDHHGHSHAHGESSINSSSAHDSHDDEPHVCGNDIATASL